MSADEHPVDVLDESGASPSVAPRELARVSLGARRALTSLASADATARLPRQGRGLAALFTPRPAPPAPAEAPPDPAMQVPPAVLAATLSAPARIETHWLTAPGLDERLHHGELALHALHDLAMDEVHEPTGGPALLLTCGQTTAAVALPTGWARTRATRCPACCAALGYPAGVGSPVCDEACTPVLAARMARMEATW